MNKFVCCFSNTGYPVSLDVGKTYKAVEEKGLDPDEISIIDNSGEAYIFHRSRFSKEIDYELVEAVKGFLGKDGKDFFTECWDRYHEISPIYSEGGLPHSVHFMEGMQVRNFMRSTPYCADWDSHDFDNTWAIIVKKAIGV